MDEKKGEENQQLKGSGSLSDSEESISSRGGLLKSAAAMALGTLSSRILGLVRDQVLTFFFSRTVTDVFYVAFGLPNKFRRLLGEGSLAVSFIPVYLEQRQKSEEEARVLSSSIYSLLWAVTATLCVLGVIFMGPILSLLVSGDGYSQIPGKFEKTVSIARIMFSYLFLVTTYAYFSALLQAHKRFFLMALAPALFNLTFIISALLPDKWAPYSGGILPWGVLAGGLVQVIVVFIPLFKMKLLPSLKWTKNAKGLGLVLKNMLPGMLGMGVLQFLTLVNINYASRLKEGSHSYIYLADRILELPQALIAISLGAVLLPTLSELFSKNEKSKMLEVGQKHMRTLLFLALPSAVGMYLLALPIVQVLYQRGMFSAEDSLMTARVVEIYALLLIAASLTKVIIPNFYAIKNTWLPALTGIIGISVHIVLGHFLVNSHGLPGLIFSMCVSAYINLILSIYFYNRMIGSFDFKGIIKWIVPIALPLGAMGGGVYLTYGFMLEVLAIMGDQWSRILSLFITILLGVVIYFVVAKIAKFEEADMVLGRLSRKFK